MVRPTKGSKEAKEWGERMRAMRGKNKIARPSAEKEKPEPAKMTGGKIKGRAVPPPSRSYDTSFEDKIDGVVVGGSLKDCCMCNGMGIVKIKK